MRPSNDCPPVRLVLTELRRPGADPRWLTELDRRTATAYARLVRRQTRLIEARLAPGVIANRTGPRGTLRPLRASRSDWRRRLARMTSPGAPAMLPDPGGPLEPPYTHPEVDRLERAIEVERFHLAYGARTWASREIAFVPLAI